MGCPWTGIRRLFAIACSLTHGGITQLVECLLCKQNVAGSNPTTSTTWGSRRRFEEGPAGAFFFFVLQCGVTILCKNE